MNDQRHPVTGKTVVPGEAVEAAAKAILCVGDEVWELQTPRIKDAARSDAYAALEAAAPFIAAKALEDAADELTNGTQEIPGNDYANTGLSDGALWHEVRSWLRAIAAAVRGEG